jgi:hypothetical protein
MRMSKDTSARIPVKVLLCQCGFVCMLQRNVVVSRLHLKICTVCLYRCPGHELKWKCMNDYVTSSLLFVRHFFEFHALLRLTSFELTTQCFGMT